MQTKFENEFPHQFSQFQYTPSFKQKVFNQPAEAKMAQNIMSLHIRQQVHKLINHAQTASKVQKEWKNFSEKIAREYRDYVMKQVCSVLENWNLYYIGRSY